MFTDMTMLTRTAYEAAMDEMLTIEDAVRFLEEELLTRSLRSKIEKFAKGRDEKTLRNLLVSGLLENHPDMKKDSVEKRVRGWMNPNSTHSLYKADAIEAAFILGLDVPEADDFVAMVSGEHLHWRSADEIIHIFALQNGLRYTDAEELASKMEKYLLNARDKQKEELQESDMTRNLRVQIEALRTEEELRDFLSRESDHLGQLHNQAYLLFSDMLEQLQTPVTEEDASVWEGEAESLTIRDVLREYLFQNNVLYSKSMAVSSKKLVRKGKIPKESQFILSRIQKDISDAWPDETSLSKMKARKTDVTRKTLILLFLSTYSGTEEDLFEDDESLTREDVFLDTKDRINYMLSLCGFSILDPRSPFDWLVIYCMCAEDLLDMDERMRDMFIRMFGEGTEGEDPSDPGTDV